MFYNLINYLIIAEFSQAILLFFIIVTMKKNKRSNLFLAFFILIPSFMFFSFFLNKNNYMVLLNIISTISIPGISLAGVLLYFYTRSLMDNNNFKLKDSLHFVIFVFLVLAFIIARNYHGPHEMKYIVFTFIGIGLINSLVYMIYSLFKMRVYLSRLENYYSDTEKMNMDWLKIITALSLLILLLFNLFHWGFFFHLIDRNPIFIGINLMGMIVIIGITAYHIVNMPELFKINEIMESDMLRVQETSDLGDSNKSKYARQSITEEGQSQILDQLKMHMGNEKSYLRENISIKDLSEEIEIPAHHLSIVINNLLGKNFYNFINEYRIHDAKEILSDSENTDASILSIAFRVGFNSKSTFNTVFKKITGLTPSQFKENSKNKSQLAS